MGSVEHDLRQRESTQDKLEGRHAAYGDRAVESIVDDIMDGKKVDGRTIHDFCGECFTWEDMGSLMMATGSWRLVCHAAFVDKLKNHIREMCDNYLLDEVSERERQMDEEARER